MISLANIRDALNTPLWCQDVTPALYIQTTSYTGPRSESSPGVYSTTCAFTDTTGLSDTSPSCTSLLPALEHFCQMSSQSQPTTACQPFLNLENTTLYEICLGQYCNYQTNFDNNYGLQGCLCGPLPATDLSVFTRPTIGPFRSAGAGEFDIPEGHILRCARVSVSRCLLWALQPGFPACHGTMVRRLSGFVSFWVNYSTIRTAKRDRYGDGALRPRHVRLYHL